MDTWPKPLSNRPYAARKVEISEAKDKLECLKADSNWGAKRILSNLTRSFLDSRKPLVEFYHDALVLSSAANANLRYIGFDSRTINNSVNIAIRSCCCTWLQE